ncbi:alpha/beta fold hydrolase [Histidinibacterium aquaticum]|nr:alpha/beta hydrolase [Histidinibacterium aquaticum]
MPFDAKPRLNVQDTKGAGPVVILLHDWPMSSEMWTPQFRMLRNAGFRVIRYDCRGFGKSDATGESYDLDALAADLHRLIEARDLREVSLVGIGMGAAEIIRYLAIHGDDRVSRLVLVSCPGPVPARDAECGPDETDPYTRTVRALDEDPEAFCGTYTHEVLSFRGTCRASEATHRAVLEQIRAARPEVMLESLAAVLGTDLTSDIAALRRPVMLLHGEGDDMLPVETTAQRLYEAIPGSRLQVLLGAPHALNLTHTRHFNSALLDFLRLG